MNRVAALLATCAVGMVLIAVASATNPPGSPADHFLAYKTRATKPVTPFAPIPNLRLDDRFDGERRFDATAPRDLLVPATVDGVEPADAIVHLQAYTIKASKMCTDDGRPCAKASDCAAGAKCKKPTSATHLGEAMRDSFGPRTVDVLKPESLLVPAGKSPSGVPPLPDDATHGVDRFKCYKAKVTKGTVGLPKSTVVTLGDQLTSPAKVFVLGALTSLCAPVAVDGAPVKRATGHLLCYKAKPAKGEAKHAKRVGLGVQDQFGILRRDTVGESTLCVPAAPAVIAPTPTPGATATATAGGATVTAVAATATPGSSTPSPGVPTSTPTPGVPCTPGIMEACYDGPPGTAGVAQCTGGIRTCGMDAFFGPCVGQVLPQAEIPGNGADEDCDGIAAPSIDPGGPTTLRDATAFLYTGANPIQTGVAPGTIELERAAVVRGKVRDQTDAPLAGVTVSVLGHPELGQTLTRADGMFDLAVNGGGALTVDYRKVGFLPAQRRVDPDWQDYARAADVVLIPLDAQMTTIDLGAAMPMQHARGSMTSDADGSRQATLLFPQGTQAEMVMPDGSAQPLTTLSVRATEYTVGPNGPDAMPGELPATSGYTYAVELSADEAMAAGAKELRFSEPIPFYVENFVGFPVGSLVPTGFYDRSAGQWVASDNGRVIAVVGITSGAADLDLDGDGAADGGAALAALGITDAERQRLASLYAPGQELWRASIPHFTPWDCNWPYGPPDDATPPGGGGSGGGNGPDGPDKPPKDPCEERGSIIECQRQTLGEVVPLTGTPFDLHYRSDRTPGRSGDANRLEIRLSGATIPASLLRIRLEISIAGRLFEENLAAAPNLIHVFTWDGKDAFGRTLQGRQRVALRIGYEYQAQYFATQDTFAASYNRFGVPPVIVPRSGGGAIVFARPAPRATAPTIILWQDFRSALGVFDVRGQGLGGWTLTAHHAYDWGNTLYLGDGSRRDTEELPPIMRTVAGNGSSAFDGDDKPATTAGVRNPQGVAVAPDGTLYIADTNNNRIRRVGTNGIITTVAGTGAFCPFGCFNGDGIAATSANLNNPRSVALGPDGSVYIAETAHDRIRRVAPNGTITTVAGNGTRGFGGDGGPATAASLNLPQDVALGPDGSLYIADGSNGRVRRVGSDGIITTIAGNGFSGPLGDGGPATSADLDFPASVAVGADGSVYIADPTNHRIRRVGIDGIITTVAGRGPVGFSGDGGPATSAGLSGPQSIALAPDGSLYIADTGVHRIRRVGPDGTITTVAGTGTITFSGDGGPAIAASLSTPAGVGIGPDGSVYVGDTFHDRIRRIGSALPSQNAADVAIASADGAEVYVFTSEGRHLRTLDAFTNATRLQFGYDASDRLISITDADGNATTVERNGSGTPTAIVGPFGDRTELALDPNGFLASVTNPAGEAFELTTTEGGLVTTFTDPRENASQITYDGQGRLTRDTDAAGGFQNLARADANPTTYTVTRSTALGRTTTYEVQTLPTGAEQQRVTFADGTQNQVLNEASGKRTLTLRNGTVVVSQDGPDPRFGMQAPIFTSRTVTTLGGLARNMTATRTATLSDPADLSSLTSQTDTVTLNTRTYTRVYDAGTRTFTLTTPAGRQSTATLDAEGRVTQLTVAGLTPLQISYDDRGRLATLAHGNRAYGYEYDSRGLLSELTDPLTRTVQFAYDDAGRTTTITRADGAQVQYAYDARGNITSLTPPGRSAHTFEYTAVDLLARYVPPVLAGPATSEQFVYNLDRQLTQLALAGTNVGVGYDAAGRLQTITVPQETRTVSYDSAGRVQAIASTGGVGLAYGYDGALLTDTTWSGLVTGTVHRTFDNNFRVASHTINGANTQSFTYDTDGLLTQAGALTLQRSAQNALVTGTTLGTVSDTRGFNAFGELATYTATAGATPLFASSYTHDQAGRITEKTETVGGVTTTFGYTHDLVGRLTQVTQNGVVAATYVYDAAGNRLSRTTPGGTLNGVYDAQDRLTQYGVSTYSYTANGDLLGKAGGGQSTAYVYDALGNLRDVTLPDGRHVEYLIDGRGRRVGKKIDGTKEQGFLYQDRLQPIAELDGTDAVVSTFVYGSRRNVPDYMVSGGATYRIISDHLGSPRLVVDTATGVVMQRMDYDEFGNVVQDTNAGFQPFGFAGGLYDPDTGLVRFGARDYDPKVGRWTSKDPIGLAGDLNLYTYVHNDPMNLIDRTGAGAEGILVLTEASAAGGAAGSAIGIAGSVIFAIALLEGLALENSALENADETGDDEGPNEGGAPQDTNDGGVCGGKKDDPEINRPTLPNFGPDRIIDAKIKGRKGINPLKPREGSPEEEVGKKESDSIPKAPRKPNIPEPPEGGFDKPPPGGTLP